MKIKELFLSILCFSLLIVVAGCKSSDNQSFKQDSKALSVSFKISDMCKDTIGYDMKRGGRYAQEIYITISGGNCTISGFDKKNFGSDGLYKCSGKEGTGNKLQDPSEADDLETYLAIDFANEYGDETLSAYAVCSNGGERIFVACAKGRSDKLVEGVDFPKINFADSGFEVPDFNYPKDVGISKTVALQ